MSTQIDTWGKMEAHMGELVKLAAELEEKIQQTKRFPFVCEHHEKFEELTKASDSINFAFNELARMEKTCRWEAQMDADDMDAQLMDEHHQSQQSQQDQQS